MSIRWSVNFGAAGRARFWVDNNRMKHLYLKAVGGLIYVFVTVSALIFISAWTFNYWQAWMFLVVFMVSTSAIFFYIAKNDPSLLARRVKTTEKETSQKIIRFLVNLAFTAVIVCSVLDHRFGWSIALPQIAFAGDALVVLGMVIIFLVFKENTFTAQTVEVEAEQRVVSTGLYSMVRHPMYVGGLVYVFGLPPALGSWWGLVPALLFMPVMVWRILDEEKLLARDLPGYLEYQGKVKYRLVPFLW